MMDIESFASMVLKGIGRADLPIADVKRLHENKYFDWALNMHGHCSMNA